MYSLFRLFQLVDETARNEKLTELNLFYMKQSAVLFSGGTFIERLLASLFNLVEAVVFASRTSLEECKVAATRFKT